MTRSTRDEMPRGRRAASRLGPITAVLLLLAFGMGCSTLSGWQERRERERRVQQAVEAGIQDLEALPSIHAMGAAFTHFLRRRFALDAFAGMPEQFDAFLAQAPAMHVPVLRPFRRLVDPDNPLSAEDPAQLGFMDRLVVSALYCDQQPLVSDFASGIEQVLGLRSHTLTQAAMAIAAVQDNGCELPVAPEVVEQLMSEMGELVAEQPAEATSYQTAAMLHYLGHGDLVSDDFVDTVLAAQLPGGGWKRGEAWSEPFWNATISAIWYMLEATDAPTYDSFVPPR